jgi:hypothetical protein
MCRRRDYDVLLAIKTTVVIPNISCSLCCLFREHTETQSVVLSTNSGTKWECSGKLENESGASLYFTVGEELRAKLTGFNVIVESNLDKSKAKKVNGRTFYRAVIEAKRDDGYEASSDEPIGAVTSQAARCAAQR